MRFDWDTAGTVLRLALPAVSCVPALGGTLEAAVGIALEVTILVKTVRKRRLQCRDLGQRAISLTSVICIELVQVEALEVLHWKGRVEELLCILEGVKTALTDFAQMSVLDRILSDDKLSDALEQCNRRITDAVTSFGVQSQIAIGVQSSVMLRMLEEALQQTKATSTRLDTISQELATSHSSVLSETSTLARSTASIDTSLSTLASSLERMSVRDKEGYRIYGHDDFVTLRIISQSGFCIDCNGVEQCQRCKTQPDIYHARLTRESHGCVKVARFPTKTDTFEVLLQFLKRVSWTPNIGKLLGYSDYGVPFIVTHSGTLDVREASASLMSWDLVRLEVRLLAQMHSLKKYHQSLNISFDEQIVLHADPKQDMFISVDERGNLVVDAMWLLIGAPLCGHLLLQRPLDQAFEPLILRNMDAAYCAPPDDALLDLWFGLLDAYGPIQCWH